MTPTRIAGSHELKEAYRQVMDRVADAAQRSERRGSEVIVVAVTKTASPDQIRTLVEMGHVDLGENREQQLTQRVAQLEEFISRKRTLGRTTVEDDHTPASVRWHMVGHLQRNKVKQVLPLVKLIHSLDSLRLAEEIQNLASRQDLTADVLLQVNTSNEATKQGVAAPAAQHLADQISTMLHLRLRGLMTMAPLDANADEVRTHFSRTTEVFNDIRTQGVCGEQFNILSMGMSNDFEVAIEQGANVVRIGRALFGEA